TNDVLTYTVGAMVPVSPTTTIGGLTLTDPNNGNANVTAGGILGGHTGQVHVNTDGVTAGAFAFSYRVSDGVDLSNTATVRVYVQGGEVIITEVMYNPANEPDNQWEWVEVKNLTGSAVTLSAMYDATMNTDHDLNLSGKSVAANDTVLLAPGGASGDIPGGGRTGAEFLTEWSPLPSGKVVWAASWPALNNSGDSILLFDAAGRLLDMVEYQADGVNWPVTAVTGGSESIYVTCGNMTAVGNDNYASWELSADGVDNAWATPDTEGGLNDSDVGSPATEPACVPPTSIEARKLFYNQSFYDGNKVAIDPAPIAGANNDDADAIDNGGLFATVNWPAKTPLMTGGGQATLANWSGYDKGINGLIYDVANPTATPVVGDFVFHNIGKAGTVVPAPGNLVVPTAFATQDLGGGVTRVLMTFTGLTNTWLRVEVGTGFGLAASEVHYWGNAAGDTGQGNTVPNILVSPTDEIWVRTHPTTPLARSPVQDMADVTKDGIASPTDQIYVRTHPSTPLNAVKMITR
ncbi:MAG: lamin tail domain-containing protein, partial [Planctomycetes bacterium]|nr:lamin tail domain-containing protein [Planctomycetota bacterium]